MEYFSTGEVLGVQQRLLPSSSYNVMRTLFHQCDGSCVFVPVRSMQYQAIIDENEVVFVYAHRRTTIEFAWRDFKPQYRESLESPVPYEFVYYDEQALDTMQRMQGEFLKFANLLNQRKHEKRLCQQPTDKTVAVLRPHKEEI